METDTNVGAARDSDNVSLVTLNLFDEDEDRAAPNKFELSDIKLARAKTNSNDLEEESYRPNYVIAHESLVLSRSIESNGSNDLPDSKVVHNEDDSSEGMDINKNIEGLLEEERQSLKTSNVGINYDIPGILEEEEEEEEEGETEGEDEEQQEDEDEDGAATEKAAGRFDRISRRFSIASDIEEVDEEMEEYELSGSESYQQRNVEDDIFEDRDAELYITETRLTLTRSRMIDRAASLLEHRLKTISDLKELYEERKMLALKNGFLNKKCCQFIERTTTVNLFENTEGALPIHGNQRYLAVLEDYTATKIDYENKKPSLERDIESLTDSYNTLRVRFEQVFNELRIRELEIGMQCVNGKTGKLLGEQRARSLVKKQQGRFNDLANVRVYYLKLNHRLADIHARIRQLNLMGEGRTLMDYEQLMIENSSHVDKLDEREEELLKLGDKCAQFVSILSHMKETSDVLVYDIMNASAKLAEFVEKKSEARTLLAIERKKRESLRKSTSKIRHASGLLGSPTMLRKMAADSEALDFLKLKVQRLMEGNRSSSADLDNVDFTPEK